MTFFNTIIYNLHNIEWQNPTPQTSLYLLSAAAIIGLLSCIFVAMIKDNDKETNKDDQQIEMTLELDPV